MGNNKILWIDNTPYHVSEAAEILRDEGLLVETMDSASLGAATIAKAADDYLAIIIDLLLPSEKVTVPGLNGPEEILPQHGQHGGITLGRWLKRRWPELNIVGVSLKSDPKDPQVRWFKETAEGYVDKLTLYQSPRTLLLRIRNLLPKEETATIATPGLSTYLVHGSNTAGKEELLRYLTSALRIPATIVLQDQQDHGIAAIRQAVTNNDDHKLVFVLMPADAAERQAVLFQAGCLYGACIGKRGKTILLHQGEAGIATRLADLITIDIRNGIMAADQDIRAVVNEYLPLLRRH